MKTITNKKLLPKRLMKETLDPSAFMAIKLRKGSQYLFVVNQEQIPPDVLRQIDMKKEYGVESCLFLMVSGDVRSAIKKKRTPPTSKKKTYGEDELFSLIYERIKSGATISAKQRDYFLKEKHHYDL